MLQQLEIFISALLGAVATAIPLYAKIRSLNLKFKSDEHKSSLKQLNDEQKIEVGTRINHEAEWKRIIEFRDMEMTRLRERDDQQEKKIEDLYIKHLECQKLEARQSERIIVQNEQIKILLEKLTKLEESLIRKGINT